VSRDKGLAGKRIFPALNLSTLRFWNDEAEKDCDAVCLAILRGGGVGLFAYDPFLANSST
jgi:very-short-patch-repair endonuclease